ncbi:hypothetical protein FSP39_015767 [Pinctada imbricata]|uniref:Uncharacterized protein n=1 Tax=Pinctada imbricata TaxID=66713 RepID=A0AA89C5X7_PINIB|nr:hypothetical protein FSP39_015767 [Pinctada imbricata]
MSSTMDCCPNILETDSGPNYVGTHFSDSPANFAFAPESSQRHHDEYMTLRLPVRNIEPPPVPKRKPSTPWKYPDYVYYAERLASFKDWPKYLKGPSKRDLARAGFVYTNVGDKVTCFWCGMTFKNWEPFDDAYKEHLKWSKDCTFAKILSDGL